MSWLIQHSPNLADAGFGLLLIAVALVLLRPVQANKRLMRSLSFLFIGVIGLLVGYWRGMDVLTTTGASLMLVTIFEFVQASIDTGKTTWRHVKLGVLVVCVIAFLLVLLSVIGSIWH